MLNKELLGSQKDIEIVRHADEIRKLRKHIQAHGIETNRTEEELTEIISRDNLKTQVRKWRREAKRLKKENTELIMRLNCGERATGEGNCNGTTDL